MELPKHALSQIINAYWKCKYHNANVIFAFESQTKKFGINFKIYIPR